MIRGSCLCGSVRYEIRGRLTRLTHCHCSMCRKAHGAAFGSYLGAEAEGFAFVAGEGEVAAYRSSPGVRRTFCRRCGATLQFLDDSDSAVVWVAAGTLDDDPGIRPLRHIWVGSKAPWYDIEDALPKYDTGA